MTMKRLYAPGCALTLYKPDLAEKVHNVLVENEGEMDRLDTCCRLHPELASGVEVINTCPGCNNRYKNNYEDSTTVSLWEVLAESDYFDFPDYGGVTMTVLDACPTRFESKVHESIRKLLDRMNINIVEPEKTMAQGTCCGDSLYGKRPVEEVLDKMNERASEMPVEDVVVYCVSCVKSIHNGGKKPRYLVDLLFGEETDPQTTDPETWHTELDNFAGVQ